MPFIRLCCVVLMLLVLPWARPVSAQVPAPVLPWPERVAVADDPGAVGAIREVEAVGLSPLRVGFVVRPDGHDRADLRRLLGEEAGTAEFEGPGSFVYRVVEEGRRPARMAGAEHFVFVTAQREDGRVQVQRTWFVYLPPRGEARGLALLMPGMFGTPEPVLNLFADKLRGRGWGVVRMMAHPSRFTERTVFEVDLQRPIESAARIAAEMTDRVAEATYAAEAAMAHVAKKHGLEEGPRIALGMSGGAMILPTVLAREPERYRAAVIIAGGANFFAMTDESNYKHLIGAVDFRWVPEEPTEEQRENAYRVYLERALLDSFHTAALLIDKPMLMIHGTFDGAVPAKLGELMWERLGKPERWVEEAGHEELFMKLPQQAERIMDWIDGAVAPEAPAQP